MNSILYIFLPCKKVYPIGVTYLADFIHRRKPEVRQRIVDLSLFPESKRTQAIRDAALDFKPDLVCFSWRDIQIFSPHEGDASLEHAFNFYFAGNPIKRVMASFAGLKQLYRYYSHIRANLSYPWFLVSRLMTPFNASVIDSSTIFGYRLNSSVLTFFSVSERIPCTSGMRLATVAGSNAYCLRMT